ncbi:40S ribosomal protein S5-1 [Hordeum vulgare]|nr:40S ribosomal protein S5-1 [Hordeum vulgare]
MTTPSPSKDKFFEKVINLYLPKVIKHPHAIEMHEGVLHIRDVQGPKKEGSEKARLATVEHEIFKFQGMVERGLSDNHSDHGLHPGEQARHPEQGAVLLKLQERIDHLQD